MRSMYEDWKKRNNPEPDPEKKEEPEPQPQDNPDDDLAMYQKKLHLIKIK